MEICQNLILKSNATHIDKLWTQEKQQHVIKMVISNHLSRLGFILPNLFIF